MKELMVSPYFGVALSIVAFWIGVKLNHKLKTPVCNPLIVAIVLIVGVLPVSYTHLVAAARAIITHPSLILADEPTGALDSKSSKDLLESLKLLNETEHTAILMVTHDAYTASYARRVIFIKDGKVFHELLKGTEERRSFFAVSYTHLAEFDTIGNNIKAQRRKEYGTYQGSNQCGWRNNGRSVEGVFYL